MENNNQPNQTAKNKPKLRSVPRATRVILRQKGTKCSQVVILQGIFERYDVVDSEERRAHVRKLLNKALDKGTNDLQDIKRHKNSFSLICKQSPTSAKKSSKVPKIPKKTKPTSVVSQITTINQPQEITSATESPTHKWQYFDNGWFDYHAEASKLVEEAYQDYIAHPGMWDVRAVKSGRWHYQVDFPNLKQTNIEHDDHTQRDIRRVAI